MGTDGWIVIGFAAIPCLLVLLFIRRQLIARPGSIEVSLRLSTYVEGRGWSPGIGRFVGEELWWFRVFSFAWRPRRVFHRDEFVVEQRRRPDAAEQTALPGQSVVLRCVSQREPVEIAMAETTVTGFMSWLEAAPPGTAASRRSDRGR
jgi:hypothetical protein